MQEIEKKVYCKISNKIDKGQWECKENLVKVRALKQWDRTRLEIYEEKRGMFFKDILHIKFSTLMTLRLSNSYVVSLECVSQIYLPQLSSFSFSNHSSYHPTNNVTFIKNLRKAFWPKLSQLSMHGNHVNDAQYLFQCCFPIEGIFIDFIPKPSHFDCYSSILKLESSSLRTLQISEKRFFTKDLSRFLRKKYPKINMITRK